MSYDSIVFVLLYSDPKLNIGSQFCSINLYSEFIYEPRSEKTGLRGF